MERELSLRALLQSLLILKLWAYAPVDGDLKGGVNQGGVLIIQRYSITQKNHAPTLNMVETFYSKNGVPIEEDINLQGYDSRYKLFKPPF